MEDPGSPSRMPDWSLKRNSKWPNLQREKPLKYDTGNKWEEESSLSFPTIRSQNRWVIIVLSFHHILRGICDDLFRTAADMVGGWAPLIMVWVVNLSSNILRSHSPPHFSVQYRHISPYHPISYIYPYLLASCPLCHCVQLSINGFHDNIRNCHR